ncbi:MAG: hypothetical protein M3220_00930, partial [Chloroflexota bacterium]|nr:hypothetical protein [Chloroflexota bacterium]
MMSEWVVLLEDVNHEDQGQVGVKAAILGTLLEAGFPVPPGLCVTTAAYHLALAPYQDEIDGIVHSHDLCDRDERTVAAERIAALLMGLTVPASVARALDELLAILIVPRTPVAVRSSATAEDRADASYAGQYTSVLGVREQRAIRSAVVACWRSFFTAHALASRALHDALESDQAMAVLIQPMIAAECAGVCFSVDPVHHRRELVVVNAAWGLGAGVVDGSVAVDTAWVKRDEFAVHEHRVVEKSEQLSLAPGGGIRQIPVAPKCRHLPCLPDPWLERVAQFGVAAELLFGRPQDVEWAIADRQLWLLQSRPIASLPPALARTPDFPVTWASPEERDRLWTLEGPPGGGQELMVPLERDEVMQVEQVREETCRFMGAERNRKIKVCNGRLYSTPIPLPISEADKRVRQVALEDLAERLHQQGRTAWDYWGPEVVRATERLDSFDLASADGPALAEHLEEALAVRRRHFMLHPLCSFDPHPAYFSAFERVSG